MTTRDWREEENAEALEGDRKVQEYLDTASDQEIELRHKFLQSRMAIRQALRWLDKGCTDCAKGVLERAL